LERSTELIFLRRLSSGIQSAKILAVRGLCAASTISGHFHDATLRFGCFYSIAAKVELEFQKLGTEAPVPPAPRPLLCSII
jgi:hypothetical protein